MRTLHLSLALAAVLLVGVAQAKRPGPPPAGPLQWTEIQYASTGSVDSWGYAQSLADSWVEDGYDDWRLPTRSEILAAVADGTFEAQCIPAGYTNSWPGYIPLWTSERQGNRYWSVLVFIDEDLHVTGAATEAVPPGYYRTECFVRP